MKNILAHMDQAPAFLLRHRKALAPTVLVYLASEALHEWLSLWLDADGVELVSGESVRATTSTFGENLRFLLFMMLSGCLWYAVAGALRRIHREEQPGGVLEGFRWRYAMAHIVLLVVVMVLLVTGLLMAGVGLLWTLPLSMALGTLIDPWLVRGHGIQVSIKRASDTSAQALRFGLHPQHVLMLVGAVGWALYLGIADMFTNVATLVMTLSELAQNGPSERAVEIVQGKHLPIVAQAILNPLDTMLYALTLLLPLHGALRAADDTEEMEEGTRIEALLGRLENAHAA